MVFICGNQNDMLGYRSSVVLVKGDHMQISFKLAQILENASKNEISGIEISYDFVVIEGYRTRTKRSYGKLSCH